MQVINQFGTRIGAEVSTRSEARTLIQRLMTLCGRFPTLRPSRLWVEDEEADDIKPLLAYATDQPDGKSAAQTVAEWDLAETAQEDAKLKAALDAAAGIEARMAVDNV